MATLIVTNTTDTVNGDVSNIAALTASDGGDGISLREAIAAVNETPGANTITFAQALAGQTIVLREGLSIERSGVTLNGVMNPDGSPAITLDGSPFSPGILLFVRESDFAVSHIEFSESPSYAIAVRAGTAFGEAGQQDITNIRIEDNVFRHDAIAGPNGLAISVGMETDASGASIRGVLIARNSFTGFLGDAVGVHVALNGDGNVIQDVDVRWNTFNDMTFGVELVAALSTNGTIEDARIIGNYFTANLQPVNLGHIGTNSGNVIDSTLISGNVFVDNRGPDVVLLGGMDGATGNIISATRIENNLMTGSTQFGGVGIVGGRGGGVSNMIDGVQIVNNTIAGNVGTGVDANPNIGGSGNTIAGVTVISSIFYSNSADFFGVNSSAVSSSLTGQSGFAGVNGNIAGDPLFVDAPGGDYRLQAGSPAIDAGLSTGASIVDIDFLGRTDVIAVVDTGTGTTTYVDIGAYEFDAGIGNDVLVGLAASEILRGGAGTDDISGNDGNDSLEGGTDNDTISGGTGDDTLDGGTGSDSMNGGSGNDTYVVDAADDVIVDTDGSADTVRASVSETLDANVELLVLIGSLALDGTGNGGANQLTGNDAVNTLLGLDGADTLDGAGGNDTLDGGADIDSMSGGAGDDVFIVDVATDQVVDSAGTDTVRSAVTLTLATGIENLVLTGSSAINGTGNASNNTITGNAKSNVLNGGGGADNLEGLGGNDTLVWATTDNYDGGAGTDTLKVLGNLKLPDLSNGLSNIERIDMTGGGNRTLTLNKSEVLDLSSSTNTLTVLGNAGDKVDLVGNFKLISTVGSMETWKLNAAIVKIETELNVI